MNLSKILLATASVVTVGAAGLAFAQSSPPSTVISPDPTQIQSPALGQTTDPMPSSTDSSNSTTGNSTSGGMNSPTQSERDITNQGAGSNGTSRSNGTSGTLGTSGMGSSDGTLTTPTDRSTTNRSASDRDGNLLSTERPARADRN